MLLVYPVGATLTCVNVPAVSVVCVQLPEGPHRKVPCPWLTVAQVTSTEVCVRSVRYGARASCGLACEGSNEPLAAAAFQAGAAGSSVRTSSAAAARLTRCADRGRARGMFRSHHPACRTSAHRGTKFLTTNDGNE